VAAIGEGAKRFPVRATVNGYTWRTTVTRMRDEFLLGLNREVRQSAGVEAGDAVEVAIELDTAPRGVDVPEALPLDRFQGSCVFFGAVYAVTNDGFVDVNPSVGAPNPTLFPAFSDGQIFAMFNDNGIDFKFVAASAPNTALVSATSSGFGAVFQNVQQAGTTIQYFHGSTLLDTVNVPTNATAGSQIFAGERFTQAIVTNVLLTLGQGVIFQFDGTTASAGGATVTLSRANCPGARKRS